MTVGNCVGRCLFRLGRLRIELWKVPHWSNIPKHFHKNVISRFIFLDRNLKVHREGSKDSRATPLFRWYTVPAGKSHWADADRGDARFLNIEWWTGKGKPESAADDFVCK